MKVSRFVKRPVVIEAMQWDGENETLNLLAKFINKDINLDIESKFVIHTLEGDMTVSLFDWIIKGVKGEFYSCKPEIFLQTYDVWDEIEY